jgi:hypothetical protein
VKCFAALFGAAALASCLGGCGSSSPSALQLASAHPDSLTAAKYVSIGRTDLPSGYTQSPAPAQADSQDAAQTLAEYRCEGIAPPKGAAPLSWRTPDFTDSSGTTELHEATTVFSSSAAADSHLALELNPRYPTCKATAFRSALVASAPAGEHIGFVTVHVSDLPPKFGDRGVEVEGLSTLTLAGGVSALATSELVVMIRGHLAAELSVETEGQAGTGLVDQLTSDLAKRLAQVVPNATNR